MPCAARRIHASTVHAWFPNNGRRPGLASRPLGCRISRGGVQGPPGRRCGDTPLRGNRILYRRQPADSLLPDPDDPQCPPDCRAAVRRRLQTRAPKSLSRHPRGRARDDDQTARRKRGLAAKPSVDVRGQVPWRLGDSFGGRKACQNPASRTTGLPGRSVRWISTRFASPCADRSAVASAKTSILGSKRRRAVRAAFSPRNWACRSRSCRTARQRGFSTATRWKLWSTMC